MRKLLVGGSRIALLLAIAAPVLAAPPAPEHKAIDFDRQVRPVLSENCYACHGFDSAKRMAGLRLDTEAGTFAKLPSGHAAIVRGKPDASPLYQRIVAAGPLKMPPAASGHTLKPEQIALLQQWIREGAKYTRHWAFIPPVRPALPKVKQAAWVRNPIDRFILARLEQERLKPSPEADRATLLRRVTLDLTGLPPTLAELNAFLADKSPTAYEKAVDRLLASPRYGERMALPWLDLARYADTHGYHIDSGRAMWRWRDWLIDAYNKNLPFDQFTIQQIAGDLLPNATLSQKLATGFNRNHMITLEGGAIPEEYAANYIFDRIDTTSTVWMGLTLKCAQCHDHKYDPITQKDFYRFYAFFHNVPENGLDGGAGNAMPFVKAPTNEQSLKLASLTAQVTTEEKAVQARRVQAAPGEAAWEAGAAAELDALPAAGGQLARFKMDETSGSTLGDTERKIVAPITGKPVWAPGKVGNALQFDGSTFVDLGKNFNFERTDKFSYGAWINPTSAEAIVPMSHMNDADNFRGYDLYIAGGIIYVHIISKWDKNAIKVSAPGPIELNKWTHLLVTYDGSSKAAGVKIYVNGVPSATTVLNDTLTGTIKSDISAFIGKRSTANLFKGMIDEAVWFGRELPPAEVAALVSTTTIRPVLAIAPTKRTQAQKDQLIDFYLQRHDPEFAKMNTTLVSDMAQKTAVESSIPTSMVMEEMPKARETHILLRGQYDKPGEIVSAGTPEVLPPLPAGLPANRLGLAKWLVQPNNPLTGRVAVNRFWQNYFGLGLVKTSENFGTQGERPSHPELLDWLATEFVRTGWNVKAMQKLIVTSAAYRQSSAIPPGLRDRDPENRLVARGPRFRLSAEAIRDEALALSGLLVDKVGGPSVKPYQPAGIWEEIAFGGAFSEQKYVQDHGENLYRRSMYTFWKRTVPPPALQAFDAPEREFCMVRRLTTNTPLQALVLMNDTTYIEASRKFAERVLTEAPASVEGRIAFVFRAATAHAPTPAQIKVLAALYRQQADFYRKNIPAAEKLLAVGESPRSPRVQAADLAAWTTVTSAILNLDETISKG